MSTPEKGTEKAASGPDHAIKARRTAAAAKVAAVNSAITRLAKKGLPLSRAGLAEAAGVSRTFTYENEAARILVDAALARTSATNQAHREREDVASEAQWRQRALNAEAALKEALGKTRSQRATIGDLLGQLRDPDGTTITDDRIAMRDRIERLREENNRLHQAKSESDRALEASRQSLRNLRAQFVAQQAPGSQQALAAPHLSVVPADDNI